MRNLEITDARIMFRNFSGEERTYNAKGDRNFCVVIDADNAERLSEDGWNIKWTKPREEGDEPLAYLPVKVNYANRPPEIWKKTENGKPVLLDEITVGSLDDAEIIKVNKLVISPYAWNVSGKSGIKAYLRSGYFTVEDDAVLDDFFGRVEADDTEESF